MGQMSPIDLWHPRTGDEAGGEDVRQTPIELSGKRNPVGRASLESQRSAFHCSACYAFTTCDQVSYRALSFILGRLTRRSPFCWRRFPHKWQPPRVLEHPCNRLSAPAHHLRNGRRNVVGFTGTAHHVCGVMEDPRPLHRPVSIERCLRMIPSDSKDPRI